MAAQVFTFRKSLIDDPDNTLGYNNFFRFTAAEANAMPVRSDGSRRFICRIAEQVVWHGALMPYGDGMFILLVNKDRQRQAERLGVDLNAVTLELTPDESEYGMPMPEELGEYLAQDELLNSYFQALTPGKQRALIHQVAKPKTARTRLQKATQIAEYLVAVRGKLDFRELRDWGKEGLG